MHTIFYDHTHMCALKPTMTQVYNFFLKPFILSPILFNRKDKKHRLDYYFDGLYQLIYPLIGIPKYSRITNMSL